MFERLNVVDALSLLVAVPVSVPDAVLDPVPVAVLVGVTDGVPEDVGDADNEFVVVIDALCDDDGVPLALPPAESVVVGDALTVVDKLRVLDELSDPDGVCDGVTEDVTVPVPVPVGVGVTERLCVDVDELVPLSEPVLLGLAPVVTLAVAVPDTDLETERVLVGVFDDVGVPDVVGEPEGVPLSLTVDVVEGVPLLLGVVDALAPRVTDGVAVSETDEESVTVELGVCAGVPLVDAVGVPVDVPEGVSGALFVDVPVRDGVIDEERLGDGVPLALPPGLSVGEGVVLREEESDEVEDVESLPVGVCVGVGAAVAVPVIVAVAVPVFEGVDDGVGLDDNEGVVVLDGVNDGDGVLLAEPP